MRRFRWMRIFVWIVLPLVLVAALGYGLRQESEFFLVEATPVQIEYQDNHRALIDHLRPSFEDKLLALKGQNIWKLSLSELRRSLLQVPWIREVELRRQFPNRIATMVTLEPIVFLYKDKKSRWTAVSDSGKLIENAASSYVPVAPVVADEVYLRDERERKRLIDLYQQVPKIKELREENIASLNFDDVTGLQLELVDTGAKVFLGKENIGDKSLRVLRVIDYLRSQKQKARVIDASFKKKVLVRPRKRS